MHSPLFIRRKGTDINMQHEATIARTTTALKERHRLPAPSHIMQREYRLVTAGKHSQPQSGNIASTGQNIRR
jgi:hypothetical protein